MKRGFIGLLALLALCSCGNKKGSETKAPMRVKTQVVSSSSANNQVTYVGIVEEREGTAVSFTSMGVVKRMLVNEGQAVSRGQLIAEMDDTQARNLLSGAEAQNYEISYVNGTLSVETILGDANGDGVVNAADIVAVIRYKKGNTPAGFVFKAADVNKDGKVDEQDVKAIEGIILKR